MLLSFSENRFCGNWCVTWWKYSRLIQMWCFWQTCSTYLVHRSLTDYWNVWFLPEFPSKL
jgi:hypothetical protein